MSKKKIIIIASIVCACIVIPLTIFFLQRNGADGYAEAPPQVYPTVDTPTILEPEFAIAPSAIGQISIAPLNYSSLGVERDSSFLITSAAQTLTEDHLRSYLSVGSGENFTLTSQPDNAFLLSFEDTLAPAQIYTLVYSPTGMQPTSHAFQTTDIFRVTSTTPANSTHNIPPNSGIEVTFSRPLLSDTSFEAAFTIYPPVNGRFLRRDNTYIFAPNELELNTVYTVIISQDTMCENRERLTEDYTFQFTTRWGTATERPFSIAGSAYQNFLPWQEVFIPLNIAQNFRERDFVVELYSLPMASVFLHPENFRQYDTVEHMETFQLELHSITLQGWEFNYLFLGSTLPEGYYLATIRAANDPNSAVLEKFIQVSALSVYSLSVGGEMVFWVHDATTNLPAAGARIQVDGGTVITDADGVAITQTRQNASEAITIEYGSFLPFAYTKRTFAPTRLTPGGRFLTYMYTDRPSYRPTDIIDIFGVVLPRAGEALSPNDVLTLHIGDMLELPVTLDAYGAFNKRVPVQGMFGFTDIRVNINGERLMSTWVNFLDYTNLSFVLDGRLGRNAYFFDESMDVEISVTNFAGLPMEGISLIGGDGAVIVTDETGIARGQSSAGWPHMREPQGWQVFRTSDWFSVASDANVSQGIGLPFILATRDIMLEIVEQPEDNIVVLTSNKITLDRFNADDSLDVVPDNFRGQPVDIDVTVLITRHITTRTLLREEYDHINRRTANVYSFSTRAETYRNTIVRTQNGMTTVTDIPRSNDPLITYSVEFRYDDSRGRPTSAFLPGQWFMEHDTSFRHFGFMLEDRTIVSNDDFGWMFSVRDLGVGQTTNVILKESSDGTSFWGDFSNATTPATGRVLAVMVRDGILSATVGTPEGTPITFPEEAISNALLFGAYFDNGLIFPILNPISVHYDYTERELQIELEFDSEKYSPGEEVTVTIRTTGSDGRPVPSRVTVSVVDESSIVGWGQHRADFLRRLYTSSPLDTWGFQFSQFASFTQPGLDDMRLGGGAEGGGGDGSGTDPVFREDFTDNPIFEVVHTDASGLATLTFTLPHQVTSWRVTALGITERGLAGDARPNVISTLPFYVDLILTNEFIVGDDIAAVARVFTDGTMPRSNVDFVFEILQGNEIIFSDTQTTAGRAVVNAGKLGVGYYTIRVVATIDEYQDAMALPFSIAETGMILPVIMQQQISPGVSPVFDFDMHPLPVRITLTNANMGPLMHILHSTLDGSSFRTDQLAAQAFVKDFIGWENTEDVRGRIHHYSGGIPELPFEEPTLFYTARFAASFPEFVNRDNIIRFARDNADTGSDEARTARLLALAAVGQPVLLEIHHEINQLVRNSDQLINTNYNTHISMLYLVAALVAAGDDAGAYKVVNQHPDLLNNRLMTGLTITQQETIHTLLLFINTAINPQGAWEYLQSENRNRHISNVPERINFVRRAMVLGYNVSEVQFYLNDVTETARLENWGARFLHITPEQFANLNLTATSGDTDVFIEFYSENPNNWDESTNQLQISKNITRDGELYRVELVVNFPHGQIGWFTIYDRLPSNMRFVPRQRAWARGEWTHITNPQRQLMEITFWRTPDCVGPLRIVYHAMKLFDADMSYGVTFISSRFADNHVWGSTR
ncbi:MAG: Ig-like domain-containing protein [Firmicutes bacterium]|nr:Ig-like domain-containing protein [Bacillota bacterium]